MLAPLEAGIVLVTVTVDKSIVVAVVSARRAGLGARLGAAKRGYKHGAGRERGVADELEELVGLFAEELGGNAQRVGLQRARFSERTRAWARARTGWLLYRRQLDQMRSRSSANAFLLLYICDLTRLSSVARSIGFLMTGWVGQRGSALLVGLPVEDGGADHRSSRPPRSS